MAAALQPLGQAEQQAPEGATAAAPASGGMAPPKKKKKKQRRESRGTGASKTR